MTYRPGAVRPSVGFNDCFRAVRLDAAEIVPNEGRALPAVQGCRQLHQHGGGINVSEVVGATNPLGELVIDSPVKPQDLAVTIYHALGVNLHTSYRALDGRPLELLPEGKPVRQLIG